MVIVKKTMTTNKVLFDTIRDLKKLSTKTNVALWRSVAKILSKSGSNKSEVNVSKINKYSNNKETVIIPGKVLGDGKISKNINVIGFSASLMAIEKIKRAGGNFTLIKDFIKKTPKIKPKILG
jgi:large subunit ribosomal protein L18e